MQFLYKFQLMLLLDRNLTIQWNYNLIFQATTYNELVFIKVLYTNIDKKLAKLNNALQNRWYMYIWVQAVSVIINKQVFCYFSYI